MTWTLCSSQAAIWKAGINASTGASSGALMEEWYNQVVGTINARTRRDWTTDTSEASFAGILRDTASDMIAIKMINYDMSGYTSRSEAQTMLDVLDTNSERNLKILSQEEYKEKM